MGIRLTHGETAARSSMPEDRASDEQLMQRYLSGDSGSFSELVHRYERELYSYLRRLLPDSFSAEDVFQSTFLAVHAKRHHYNPERPFRPWLYTLATNQAIDALRRHQRRPRTSLDQPSRGSDGERSSSLGETLESTDAPPIVESERRETARIVRSTVAELPEHLRITLVLSYYQGMKYKEIADQLGVPVGTVKSRLHAAVVRLTSAWKRLGLGNK